MQPNPQDNSYQESRRIPDLDNYTPSRQSRSSNPQESNKPRKSREQQRKELKPQRRPRNNQEPDEDEEFKKQLKQLQELQKINKDQEWLIRQIQSIVNSREEEVVIRKRQLEILVSFKQMSMIKHTVQEFMKRGVERRQIELGFPPRTEISFKSKDYERIYDYWVWIQIERGQMLSRQILEQINRECESILLTSRGLQLDLQVMRLFVFLSSIPQTIQFLFQLEHFWSFLKSALRNRRQVEISYELLVSSILQVINILNNPRPQLVQESTEQSDLTEYIYQTQQESNQSQHNRQE